MNAARSPAGTRFVWALRTYGWTVIACALALAAVPLLVEPEEPTYQADALVVARQLGVPEEALPRLGQAVFSAGVMEERIAADPTLEVDTAELIPERLSLVAAEDSVVLVVQARDPDPATAARLATVGATILAEELNRGGAGVGIFGLQAEATLPTQPLATLDFKLLAAIGALAGAVLGLGLVALIAAARRPVITGADVEATMGVPLLGTVKLPRSRRHTYHGPVGVRGMATVTRWLGSVPPGRLLFISSPSAAALRQRVLVMVGVALSILRPVRVEAPQEILDAVRRHRFEDGTVLPRVDAGDELVLVDGSSPLELIDPSTSHLSVIAVAPLGVPRRRLRALASDYADAGLVGVVLVEVRLGRRAPVPGRKKSVASSPVVSGQSMPEREPA